MAKIPQVVGSKTSKCKVIEINQKSISFQDDSLMFDFTSLLSVILILLQNIIL